MRNVNLERAAFMRPPSTGNDNDVSVSTTSSAAIATGIADGEEFITITCDVAFNFRFGASNVADPSAVYPFPAGTHSFSPRRGETHFKIRATGAGAAKWWHSS